MTLAPITQTQELINADRTITPFFKLYLDALQRLITPSYTALKIGDSGATIWDLNNQPVSVLVLTQNVIITPAGLSAGSLYRITLVQDATGSRTVTWGSVFKWPSAIPPVLSTAANAVDELWFSCDGTNMKGVVGAKDLR